MYHPLGECFTSWLTGLYGSSLDPSFEIGSLNYFRSPKHIALFDHVDSAGDFLLDRVEDFRLHTLSANMFLPKQSVWSFETKDTRYQARREKKPEPTPDSDAGHDDDEVKSIKDDASSEDDGWSRMTDEDRKSYEETFARWEVLSRDIIRQRGTPGLLSGNTVIDKRNFAML